MIHSIWDVGFCFAHFDLKIEKPFLEREVGDFFPDYFMKYCMLRNGVWIYVCTHPYTHRAGRILTLKACWPYIPTSFFLHLIPSLLSFHSS